VINQEHMKIEEQAVCCILSQESLDDLIREKKNETI
jgi:hypothetical protein